MLKKNAFLSVLFLGNLLFSQEIQDLPFYKETCHFQAFCIEKDSKTTEIALQTLEDFLEKLKIDFTNLHFNYCNSEKIKLKIYPDIESFHKNCDKKIHNNSDWAIATFIPDDNSLRIVSFNNPGPMHTEESAIKSGKTALAWGLMYSNKKYFPSWLAMGLGLYEAKAYSEDLIYKYLMKNNHEFEILPMTQLELELCKNPDRSVFISYYVLVEYLVTNWGWDKTLALLENYSDFESILGMSKEDFRTECIQYYQSNIEML